MRRFTLVPINNGMVQGLLGSATITASSLGQSLFETSHGSGAYWRWRNLTVVYGHT